MEVVEMELSGALAHTWIETAKKLHGAERRLFMAQTVHALGVGGQRLAERELGWSRVTVRKGMHELKSGIRCQDACHLRGRWRSEEHLPRLLSDIRDLVDGESQTDPRFQTRRLYVRISAARVRALLIGQKGYVEEELPTVRTICQKLNGLGYHLRKVAKCKPKKRFVRRMPSLNDWRS
jgi:hypothetical protein